MNDSTRPYFRMYEADSSRNCRELAFPEPAGGDAPRDRRRVAARREDVLFLLQHAPRTLPASGIYDTALYNLELLLGFRSV